MTAQTPAGLQAQRTALAWARTALTLIVTTLLMLRTGVRSADTATQVLASFVALASGGFLVVAVRRRIELHRATASSPAAWMTATVAAVVASAGMATVAVFLAGLI